MKNIFIISTVILGIIVIVFISNAVSNQPPAQGQGYSATIYKSPTCGCCNLFSDYMKREDFAVEVVNQSDTSSIKSKYEIPQNMQSCHTTVIGNYFIEGHIPVEAIYKLLTEKPDIKGIAMPGMPSGSPGMPGAKTGPFTIYQLSNDGEWTTYMTI